MRIKITYTLTGSTHEREDILRWPDIATLEAVMPHASAYLDMLYVEGNYSIVKVEEA